MARDVFTGPGLTQEDLNKISAITRKWAREKRAQLIANVSKFGLVDSGTLLNSIKSGVRTRDGEVNTIWFSYQFYGMFHDKGAVNVGRGKMNLPAKHWMSKYVYGSNLNELLEDLSQFYSELAIKAIKIEDIKA